MRKAQIYYHDRLAGLLEEIERGGRYRFIYDPAYDGPSISMTMPAHQPIHDFDRFPPFFEGLLPEGHQLEGLLFMCKIDRDDAFSQLVTVGGDMVGPTTAREVA